VLIGVLGLILASGFLDNKILPLGQFGTLLSAGAIPLIYSLIGLKVGAELSNIILELNQIQGKEDEII
jgi:multicomponent Na+:H+ antiporter subunit B